MPNVRKIPTDPRTRQFYLVDANFLANRYITATCVADGSEQQRVVRCQEWWSAIDGQLKRRRAIVYVPDVCITEAFKVLATKYYSNKYFSGAPAYKAARDRLIKDIRTSSKSLKAFKRHIKFHDISTNRDIIIAVDRFFEVFMKHKLNVSVPDLLLLATAKYLIDFYNVPKADLHIVTMDRALWKGSKILPDIPSAFNPNSAYESAEWVFS
jgi:hypothetical protein